MLSIVLAAAIVPDVIRDTPYDWRCAGPQQYETQHQRQDKAIVSCMRAALERPGQTYYVEGGRYRVVVADEPIPPPKDDPPSSSSATLSWTAPTQMSDGAPIGEIAEYRIYMTDSPDGSYGAPVAVVPGTQTTVTVPAEGMKYFAVTAVVGGVESAYSAEAAR